ncbi:MAG: DNA polymerase/3'-5' exonuclease PolX [Phycisphaerae bacterium]|nr:MAG: DNA polymerase/3'-5' exonuclease PolX [Phycisphaerae bacterium]
MIFSPFSGQNRSPNTNIRNKRATPAYLLGNTSARTIHSKVNRRAGTVTIRMIMSTNSELAELFRTAAAVMEIKGEPVFKSIAFTKVARLLEEMPDDIRQAVEDGSISRMEGIGKSSRKIIEDYIRTGVSPDVEELKTSIPAGLIPMLQVPSLGPKTIALFWKQRGITSLDELKVALESGKLEGLKGIGAKKLQSIREGIELLSASGGRKGLVEALDIAGQILKQVRSIPGVKRAQIAGSLRRWKETIGDVDILASLKQSDHSGSDVTEAFTRFPQVTRVLGRGQTKASVLTASGLQVDLRIVPDDHFGAALQYFTGSKEHNVKLRSIAQTQGMTLNEWGLYRIEDYDKSDKQTGKPPEAKPVASKSEPEIYSALGLSYIEPELREDRGEIELAQNNRLPKLIELSDIVADLHTHTTASDGQNSIEQMVEAALRLGYKTLGITDHSKSQVIANGLSVERLLAHVKQIRAIAERTRGIRVLAGCEVDILSDGSLDYEDAVLSELDFVIASPHVSLKQDGEKATNRLLRAIEHRYVNIIGHPTGRLINARSGLHPDWSRVFESAKQAGVALEINAGWPRLDLNDINARSARSAGVMLSINTDAHSVDQLDQMILGVSVARRAGLEKSDVLNTLEPRDLMSFFAKKR